MYEASEGCTPPKVPFDFFHLEAVNQEDFDLREARWSNVERDIEHANATYNAPEIAIE